MALETRDANICVVVLSPGAAIATEDAPEEARQRMPGPEFAGNRFVLAAQAPMELSGKLLTLVDGELKGGYGMGYVRRRTEQCWTVTGGGLCRASASLKSASFASCRVEQQRRSDH